MEKLGFIAFLIPLLLIMVAVEWAISHKKNKNYYNLSDVVVNLCCGLLERLFDFFWIVVSFFVFTFVHDNFAIYNIPNTTVSFIILILVADLCSYWFHRLSHEINFMWAAHIVHHQSEELNLTTVFRVSAFAVIFRTPFWSILPFLGFDPAAVTIAITIIGFYQMLVHTRLVKSWGVLEKIMVTPSNHRVHHAYNDQYLDTNYGGIFIIWDRLFGTYAKEEEAPKFGITSGFQSTDPYRAHLFYWSYLFRLAKKAQHWKEKVQVFFAHPRWLPKNVNYEDPEYKTDDNGERVQFKPQVSLNIGVYTLVNAVLTTLLFVYMISFREDLSNLQITLITASILLGILAHGRVLEQKFGYVILEFFRLLVFLWILPYVLITPPFVPIIVVVGLAVWLAVILLQNQRKRTSMNAGAA
ncbi:MAG: sterol desaturase family protein [Phaeodactylibacter sp.]|nr:sterol desaturase family protein [Phaeodactylibacter sp.]